MIETEAKIKLTKEEFFRLIEIFRRPLFFHQRNLIFEIPKGFIRIRKEKGKNILTLKKESKGEFNSREEIELEVSNFKEIENILGSLGLTKSFLYKKRRANIPKNNCMVSLDILQNNDFYIEIEGSPSDIKKIIRELKLESHDLERRSYFEILQ